MAVAAGWDARLIAAALADRIESLAAELLPGGVLEQRRLWRVGSLAGEPGQSLAVWFHGAKRGRWRDYASGEYGDALDLVTLCAAHGDRREAVRWARNWLGYGAEDEAAAEVRRERARRAAAQRDKERAREIANARADAFQIWRAAAPLAARDPAWRYLEGRGIELAKLRRLDPRSLGALRTHPRLWNVEAKAYFPALVALVAGADGKPVAVHRTWLDRDGRGKAPVEMPKKSLGPFAGGLIRLWRGLGRGPWKEAQRGEMLILGEGIEDVLSFLGREPKWRAASAVSLSAMGALELPAAFLHLGLLKQNDPKGSPAAQAFERVVAHFLAEGRRVYEFEPPRFLKDINDLVLSGLGEVAA